MSIKRSQRRGRILRDGALLPKVQGCNLTRLTHKREAADGH